MKERFKSKSKARAKISEDGPTDAQIDSNNETNPRENIDPHNIVSLYLKEIGAEPLLSRAEEKELAEKIRAGRLAQKRLDNNAVEAEKQLELKSTIHEGQAARQQFVEANLRLAVSIAKKYFGSLPFSDLIQEANLALWDSVDNFDPSRGNKFSSYATSAIHRRLSLAIFEDRMVKLPAYRKDELRELKKAEKLLGQKAGRKPTAAELSSYLNWDVEKIQALKQWRNYTASLNDPLYVNPDGDLELGDVIEDDSPSAEQEIIDKDAARNLLELLKVLDERDQQIIRMKFGINEMSYTLAEIADMFDITINKVVLIIEKGLRIIRHRAKRKSVNFEEFI